ncbi:mechanosensitive ion channel family protein [Desulfolucanica intricata]|uniref:mechanosensitive ion channel family protein n=1 Tax=Desulfolucanica intricata TaxID=1285191 RepID=UPI0008324D15|nr:mechanosensitive ion channel family protein [Desulfolucanica intricata]
MQNFKWIEDLYINFGGKIEELSIALLIFLGFLLFRGIFIKYIFKKLLNFIDKTDTELNKKILRALEKPLKIFFLILGIYASLSYLPLTAAQDVLITKIFRSAIVILIAMFFYNFEGDELFLAFQNKFKLNIDKILVPFFSKILRFVTIVLAVSIVAQEWGYDVNGFIAGLGLGGLAFALAAKDTVANIFGGIVVITDKPFSIGDWIKTPSVEGTVEDITFRSIKVRTFEDAVVSVPNATLVNEPIVNWSRMGKRRITFKLGVEYGTSKDKLNKCISEIKNMLENHPEIHKQTIFVRFDSFGESSLDIFLYFFTNTTVWSEYLRVKEDVNFKIMSILENEEVNVAFPSRSIYVETPAASLVDSAPEQNS